MSKLTLLGGLRSSKLELKGALGAAKETPRGDEDARSTTRNATEGFGVESRTLIFWPRAPPKVT